MPRAEATEKAVARKKADLTIARSGRTGVCAVVHAATSPSRRPVFDHVSRPTAVRA